MKYFTLILLLITNTLTAQNCKTESEIPSTTPDTRFIDNGNGTVSDNGTGLMWHKCQLGFSDTSCTSGSVITYTWQQALDEANSNTLASYNNWRLPNHKELLSLVEQRCITSINTNYFPNTTSFHFWSASPYSTGSIRTVTFDGGFSWAKNRNESLSVRLVRFRQ